MARLSRAFLADGMLALDETREAFALVLGDMPDGRTGRHRADVVPWRPWRRGGQLAGYTPARWLSNIPLVCVPGRAGGHGLALPGDGRARFTTDQDAPDLGDVSPLGVPFRVEFAPFARARDLRLAAPDG